MTNARVRLFACVQPTPAEVEFVEKNISPDSANFLSKLDTIELRRMLAYRRAVQAGYYNEGTLGERV